MLERDNVRLRGMLGVERQRVNCLRRSMSYAQRDLYYEDAEGEEAFEEENVKDENLHGMDKEFETRLDGTLGIRSRSWLPRFRELREMTIHEFFHKDTKNNKQLRHDLGNHDHQKDYANMRHKPLELQVGDKVMLKVCPWTGVMQFCKRGSGTLEQLSRVHSTFRVSNLKKCLSDETQVIPLDEIQIDDTLHFIEEHVEIMDREVKRLKQRHIPIVKVR
ncbi:hypothetical protein Tco_1431182 [Tanacetum coccineum]